MCMVITIRISHIHYIARDRYIIHILAPSIMVHDVIVIGAGIEGTSTAYHLARRGLDVLLIEQFPWPHNRGSSHGHSRALRKTYISGHWYYADLANKARDAWRKIEKETGFDIYREIGTLSFALDPKNMEDARKSLIRCGHPYEPQDIADVRRRYPVFQFPNTASANLEREAGVLLADNALKALMVLYQRHGGHLRDREQVIDVTPGDVITVQTTRTVHQARHLVITAGPWAGKLLKTVDLDLPLQPKKIMVMYWKEKVAGSFSMGKIPGFRIIDGGHDGSLIYAIPSLEYPGLVKLCLHDGPDTDPDTRDNADTAHAIQVISGFIQKYLPGLEDKPSVIEPCIYTTTPDSDFILDTHPNHNNIAFGAGFSGHGFKMAPIVGSILADIVTGQDPGVDMKPFSVKRFNKTAKL